MIFLGGGGTGSGYLGGFARGFGRVLGMFFIFICEMGVGFSYCYIFSVEYLIEK